MAQRRQLLTRLGQLAGLGSALLLGACSTPPEPARPAPAKPTAPPPPRPRPSGQSTPEPSPAHSRFIWPVIGPILGRFDGSRNKGIDIGGELGTRIVASESGEVVFVGGQLRGYGQMVIIKHDENFITAYAHTSKILVKEKQRVRKGQAIAEMGSSGTNRVMLHFELRRRGVAINPQPYLEGRER